MREATTFPRILEMKLRFEIGRKLLRSSVDRDGFLRRGCTRACLNDDGKIPSERERLTRFVMIGPSSLKQFQKESWDGRLPATPISLKSTAFPLCLENFGINPWCVGSLDNCFGFDWGMDVENGSEGGGKLICEVGCVGSWLCVERGSEDVAFEVVNINGIVGAVLDGCLFGCGADVQEEFECERFVIRLVGFMVRKVCDNGRRARLQS